MDYVASPESFYGPDMGKTAFAASPNSLYMYDQERHDMQNTLNSGMFGSVCQAARDMTALGAEPEFDLNPQYENSNSLECYFGPALMGSLLQHEACEGGNLSDSPSVGFRSGKASSSSSLLGLLASGNNGQQVLKMGGSGPTLTELNMSNVDPYLLEDIESFLSSEEEDNKPRVSPNPKGPNSGDSESQAPAMVGGPGTVKIENSPPRQSPFSRYTSTANTSSSSSTSSSATSTQSNLAVSQPRLTATPVSNLFSIRPATTQNVAVVPPICCEQPAATNTTTATTATLIKSEPMDTYETTSSNSCLHKILSSPHQKSITTLTPVSQCGSPPGERLVMPVVGQTRAPPLGQRVKSESVEEKWKEIEKFIHDPEQEAASRKRKRYASGDSSIEDGDMYDRLGSGNYSDDDTDSDADSDYSDSPLEESLTELAKKSKQYFWQYNVQAKGPKGTRLKLRIHDDDPHHPSNFEDPVFDASSTSLVGIRHGGKARKGDGNEVTPNPKKLFHIGKLLYKLNKQINSFQMSNDLPASVRNKSRKEKNKLASRACRLKKKAQHEANKIKLTGLDCEQGELLEVIHLIWPQLKDRAQQLMKGLVHSPGSSDCLTTCLEAFVEANRKTIIAGNTTDYVNEVIAKVEEGDITGGLLIKPRMKSDK